MAGESSSLLTSGLDPEEVSLTAEDVASAADDLLASLDLLVRCGLSTEGLTSVEEAQDRLHHHLQTTERGSEPQQRSPSKVMGAIQDEVERDSHIRKLLSDLFSQAGEYFRGLDQPQREQLDTAAGVQGWEDKLQWYQDRLTRSDCPILVAGETSAGKSSILNMLLGEEILPYSLLSTTSVICELKYGAKRCAVAHLAEPDRTTGTDTLDIVFQDSVPIMQQLAPYVQQQGDRSAPSPYKKVEIFWPLEYLKGFAFIYVINSGTAGGVQEDRLQGNLDTLYMRDIRKYEIDYGNITCDRTTDFISEGCFGAVYRASLKKADGSIQPVALKILKDDIIFDTVSEFLVEEDNLKFQFQVHKMTQ
ncbi:uncharacterized protein LOC118410594 [Branchiostoma floridae]|uniref:Uncharacterized protein LOC118410594 n=1 Tax=Branchiostoma floridae TaxID=7739 RepID=A0A9J7KQF7_BRAFL|nr:uncharacterized protein LOC118410594 [Branchiostoma floridae]